MELTSVPLSMSPALFLERRDYSNAIRINFDIRPTSTPVDVQTTDETNQ